MQSVSLNFNNIFTLTFIPIEYRDVATLNDTERREQMESNWDILAPICFQYERETERSKNISQILRKAFLDFPLTDKRALRGLNVVRSPYTCQSDG